MYPAEISRVPLWHPWADFLRAKTKWPPDISRSNIMIYQQMKPGTSKFRPTSFSCDFDWEIHFLHYFYDIRLFSKSKSQFQGQISKIPFLTIKARNICVIPLFLWDFVWKIHLCYMYYFGDSRSSSRSKVRQFQDRKQNGRQIFQGQIWLF